MNLLKLLNLRLVKFGDMVGVTDSEGGSYSRSWFTWDHDCPAFMRKAKREADLANVKIS